MPFFDVVGIGKQTNRKRTKRYKAKGEEHARLLAENDGTVIESITKSIPSPATERQLNYARDLDLSFPENINVEEMSHLISRKVDDDLETPLWLQEWALAQFPEESGLAITKYVGIRTLFGFLIYKYGEDNDLKALVTLFVYSVINDFLNTKWTIPFDRLAEEGVVASIAEELWRNQKVVGSIRRYSNKELVSPFGEYTDSEGFTRVGASMRTIGYQTVKDYLIKRGLIPEPK
jgi:hypothetical protein